MKRVTRTWKEKKKEDIISYKKFGRDKKKNGKKYSKIKFIQGRQNSVKDLVFCTFFVNNKHIETIWQIRCGGELNTGWHDTFTETLKRRRLKVGHRNVMCTNVFKNSRTETFVFFSFSFYIQQHLGYIHKNLHSFVPGLLWYEVYLRLILVCASTVPTWQHVT